MTPHADADLRGAVTALRDGLQSLELPLVIPGVAQARGVAAGLVQQLDDYVIPRLRHLDAPLLCVVGGSTGAGKSTLVNSVVGAEVSQAGVLRPTTRASVLVHHPQDRRWFEDGRVLPELSRLTGGDTPDGPAGSGDASTLRLVESESLRPGLALLDAPDIDSVVHSNRELSRQLLAAADLWLFVTTAARYADAVPWDLLREAAERGTTVAIVLDRVPPEAMHQIRDHLGQMLQEQGLGQAPVFPIMETTVEQGLLPAREIERLRSWLEALGVDGRARDIIVRRTLDGALASLSRRTAQVVAHADDQLEAHRDLERRCAAAYRRAGEEVEQGIEDGTLLRGEVLARWQELVGTGEFLRQIEAGIARARDRVTAFFKGKAPSTEPLGEALQTGAAALITAQAELAATATARSWRAVDAGAVLVQEHPELAEAGPDLHSRVDALVRQWQGDVLELIRSQVGHKRATARYLAFGVNGLAVLLMLVVFSATAGLTGAEVAIAGGSAVLAQRLLEAVFGDQAVRDLAAAARRQLLTAVEALMEQERSRYESVLAARAPQEEAIATVRAAATQVEAARTGASTGASTGTAVDTHGIRGGGTR